jgi:IS5 family transposase
MKQTTFTDIEYAGRKKITRREEFLDMMDEIIPWDEWGGIVKPYYYESKYGRKPRGIETMLRMYLLQIWFSLSDAAVEDSIYDSYAMRKFMRIDFVSEQVPDATTLLKFRHRIEKHGIGEMLFDSQNKFFSEHGYIMRGGTIVDATLIAAPSSTKNVKRERDPEMHQTKKGNQWYFGMKAHAGVDAGTGYVHTVTVTAANVSDVAEAANLIREDDEVVYGDAGYLGIESRPEIAGDETKKDIEFRIAKRRGGIRKIPEGEAKKWETAIEYRKASVRSKVEHVFLIVKRDFGYRKAVYRGLEKNLNRFHMLFASANYLMRARAARLSPVPLMG